MKSLRSLRIRTALAWMVAAALITSGRSAASTAAEPFEGTWQTTITINGQPVSFQSVHHGTSYANSVLSPGGAIEVGSGTFEISGKNQWKTTAVTGPSDSGTYRFLNADAFLMKGQTGVESTFQRVAAAKIVPTNPSVAFLPAGSDVKSVSALAVARAALAPAKAWFPDAQLFSISVENPDQSGAINLLGGGSVRCSFYSSSRNQGILALSLPTGVIITLPLGVPPGPNLAAIPDQVLDLPAAFEGARRGGLKVRFTGAELNQWNFRKDKPAQAVWSLKTLDDTGNLATIVSASTGKLLPATAIGDDVIKDYNEMAARTGRSISTALDQLMAARTSSQESSSAWNSGSVGTGGFDMERSMNAQRAAERAYDARQRGDSEGARIQAEKSH